MQQVDRLNTCLDLEWPGAFTAGCLREALAWREPAYGLTPKRIGPAEAAQDHVLGAQPAGRWSV